MDHCIGKRFLASLLCICFLAGWIPFRAFASALSAGQVGGYLAGNLQTVTNLYTERNFTAPAGHGFVAERANNLADQWRGKNATVVGGDNQKNGADRIISNRDNTLYIQDKYYQTARESVNSAFDSETSLYRYIDPDGQAMTLEVPADQYEDALILMRQKISEGKVPGVTDPADAENYVKKGAYTYEQVKNIAKAGTIDSLKYDAERGIITATCAAGISFVLDFVSAKMNGEETQTALHNAALNGLKTGGFVFATYVISSQLSKTGLKSALAPATDAIATALGTNVSNAILQSFGVSVDNLTKKQIISKVSSILQSQLITSGVIIVALSASDVYDLFLGRISAKQMLKNLTVTIASVGGATAGGIAGGAVGTAIAPGVGSTIGTFVGGTVGGMAGGYVSQTILDKYYQDDADEMYQIISDQFQILCENYLINEEEADELVSSLQTALDGDKLKDMYKSSDREQFAIDLMTPLFVQQVNHRSRIEVPSEEDIRTDMKASLQGIVMIH
jgi:hypothetical protein